MDAGAKREVGIFTLFGLVAFSVLFACEVRAEDWVPLGHPGTSVLAVAASRAVVITGTGNPGPCEPGCAGEGIFRTTDASSWVNVLPAAAVPPGRIPAVASDARDPAVMYAEAPTFSTPGLWKSSDSGISWFPLPLSADVVSIRTTPEPGPVGTVWVAGTDGIYRSRDQGAHWTKLTAGPARLGVLAPAPSDPSIVYAADSSLGGSALYKSRDGGETWSPVAALGGRSAIGIVDAKRIAVDPSDPNRVYAFTQQTFFGVPSAEFSHLFTSVDGGSTWRDTGLLGSGPLLAPAPFVVYASTFRDTVSFTHQVVTPSLLWSTNGGIDWVHVESGLPGLHFRDLARDSTDPDTVYGVTDEGVFRLHNPPPSDTTLIGGRFTVSVVWLDPSSAPAAAHPVRLSDNAVAFWFFTPNNIELVAKIVDGQAVNGSFWIFGGSLTDVACDVRVTDTFAGRVWQRHKNAGVLESFADTRAF